MSPIKTIILYIANFPPGGVVVVQGHLPRKSKAYVNSLQVSQLTSGFGEDSSSESEEEQPREPGEPGTSIPNLELSLVSGGQQTVLF